MPDDTVPMSIRPMHLHLSVDPLQAPDSQVHDTANTIDNVGTSVIAIPTEDTAYSCLMDEVGRTTHQVIKYRQLLLQPSCEIKCNNNHGMSYLRTRQTKQAWRRLSKVAAK